MLQWSPGIRLGPYELVAPVGEGGMGEVWRATDTRLQRTVAIKRLKQAVGDDIAREARAIAALNHPHICTLYDVGDDYLVMEFIDGAPPAGPLAPDEALRVARQIGDALAAAHARGILHRDLKPSNVMVSGRTAKLLDFGLARTTAADPDVTSTSDGVITGTAAYMSPEQARGEAIDRRSDIFSFGAVLYELLGGRRAFAGSSMAEVLSAVLRDEPPPLAAPAGLARVVTRCLRKLPAERYQSMTEVLHALEESPRETADDRASVAVLPFADMSPARDHEYFSDGLAEEVINVLAQIPALRVIARTSSFAFKGRNADVREVARTLGVSQVLEGSVRRAGDRIRVTAQLITARDGSHLWSERYDRDLADVFAVQDEIAAAIARALTATLGQPPAPAPQREYLPALPAYEAFLKGRHQQFRFTPEAIALTRQYFEQAIALDPAFPMPYLRLGGHYFNLAMMGIECAADTLPKARAAALRAVELGHPDVHCLLGAIATASFDWATGTRHFEAARAVQPVSAYVRGTDGLFRLTFSGRATEAVEQIRPALSEDPLSVLLHHQLGTSLLACDRHDEAREQFREVVRLEPTFVISWSMMAISYWLEGLGAEALASAERGVAMRPTDPVSTGVLAALLDERRDARSAALFAAIDQPRYGAAIGRAVYYMIAGHIERAADAVEAAIAEQFPATLLYLRLPLAAPLRASAFWPPLARRMNLADALG
jgi:serine/threonine-protein kinase